MKKIDVKSLILGVLLSIAVTGFYDTVFYSIQLRVAEAWSALYATIVTVVILVLYWILYFRKNANTKSIAQNEDKKNENIRY